MTLDQRQGLTVRVYNQNGKLVQEAQTNDLPLQMPSDEIELLRNYRGEVKLITFW